MLTVGSVRGRWKCGGLFIRDNEGGRLEGDPKKYGSFPVLPPGLGTGIERIQDTYGRSDGQADVLGLDKTSRVEEMKT